MVATIPEWTINSEDVQFDLDDVPQNSDAVFILSPPAVFEA
jgi:hypothetical protein